MKAILLAGLMALVVFAVMTVVFRTRPMRERARFLARLWVGSVPVLLAAYFATPPDLWLLPPALQDDPPWFGPIFSIGLWFAGFFGGILQLYNLTERGMSLRILIDIAEAGERGMDMPEVMRDYSRGQGIVWMYQKRLDGLFEHQLVALENDVLVNQPKGRRVAIAFSRLRRLFGLGTWT